MSSFAYLDPATSFLELALGNFTPIPQDSPLHIQAEECELDDSWKEFEQNLGNFKRKLAKVKRDLGIKTAELEKIHKSSQIAKVFIDNIPSDDLKAKILEVVDNYESEEGIYALTKQCGELKGQFEAMKKVLENTEAERYAKFTCFICMERNIDLFFDPCGHTICEPCWRKIRDRDNCPGCRGHLLGVKKIYNM
jgi:hypothetical protein